ncbi:MAG: NADH-quinone oxidoreductase subunit NuoN [Hydrogenophaga sp.]|jgi:NADH-quinone oxidoreductase subunit N|uniref:NADH-quinone oxidoreductase subunit NuoN n=1 Tax=Hydrogenophaga sp. TaxID=1904254 RepID=UPI002610FDC9|nr:NADH-quinone oxidoreductase subunit NuoN [Hydrogenophaga sp.]MCW5671466.1 NADH-quinone oxidoreductase subunit NuoN [Hydrogenophaga sp.]
MIDKLSWVAAYPEILLMTMACVIALVDLAVKTPLRGVTYGLTLLTLGVIAVLQGLAATSGNTVYGFGGMIVSDPMGNWLKCFASIAMMVTFVYGRAYSGQRDMLRGGELFSLGMFALLGMFVMISSHHFLVIYLGLELLTLSSYALVALRRDDVKATEAAMKYFVLGALASGFLLYGLSMVYGATGSLNLTEVMLTIAGGDDTLVGSPQVLTLGLVFVVAGLAFKLGVVPFHMWVPDVYHGAPTAITLMIGGAPKLAAFAIVIRLLVEGLQPLAVDWQQMLAVLAVLSLLVGNLAAIAQNNLKRMLAFSTIAQMGFLMLGLLAGVVQGADGLDSSNMANAYGSSMFYVVTYVLTTLGTFGVILLLSRSGFESENISDLAGLNQRSPLYAGVMAVCMFSLAGVPPLVGFYAKLAVLQALLASSAAFYVGLAVFAVIMSLIGAFYYLRVVKIMYFDAPTQTAEIEAGLDARAVLSVNGLLVLVLGIVPGGLMTLCAQAVAQLLG